MGDIVAKKIIVREQKHGCIWLFCMMLLLCVAIAALAFVGSIAAGALWGFIPAWFKSRWNTNETLFTLMMNYVATSIVACMTNIMRGQASSLGTLNKATKAGWFPVIMGQRYTINIIVVIVLTFVMYAYLRFSKQGYEIAVVGESRRTASYAGIKVDRVIIRTMALSGALCGLIGLLLTSVLYIKKVKGSILIGILGTWILGMLCQLTGLYVPNPDAGAYTLFPTLGITDFTKLSQTFGQCFKLDFGNVGILNFVVVIFSFLFVDLFDTLGTLIGVSTKANMLDKDGNVVDLKEDEDALDTFNLARMDADNERENRYADEDELADAGFDYVADEEVDASYDDEGDEF